MIAFRLVAILILVAVGASALAADRIEMTVTRDKEPIGTHSVSFIKDGARLHVDTKVEIAAKLAFVRLGLPCRAGGRLLLLQAGVFGELQLLR